MEDRLELLDLLLLLLFISARFCNIGVYRNEPADTFVNRSASDMNDDTVFSGSFKFMWFKFSRECQPVLHLLFNITLAIFTALGIKAQHCVKRRPRCPEFLGKFQQIEESLIGAQQFQIAIKDRDPLINKIEGL